MKALVRLLARMFTPRPLRSSAEGQFLNAQRTHNARYV